MTTKFADRRHKPEHANTPTKDCTISLTPQRRKELNDKFKAVRALYMTNDKNGGKELEYNNSR